MWNFLSWTFCGRVPSLQWYTISASNSRPPFKTNALHGRIPIPFKLSLDQQICVSWDSSGLKEEPQDMITESHSDRPKKFQLKYSQYLKKKKLLWMLVKNVKEDSIQTTAMWVNYIETKERRVQKLWRELLGKCWRTLRRGLVNGIRPQGLSARAYHWAPNFVTQTWR